MLVNLMKLEMKKNKFGWYFKGGVIANLLIVLFMCFMPYADGLEGKSTFSGVTEALWLVGTLVRVTFVIFASVLFAKLVIVNDYSHFVQNDLTSNWISLEFVNIIVQAIAATGMSLISLYFGMRKKSVPTTIVSSLLIIGVVSSNNGGFTLSSIIAIPLTLGLIGVCVAYFTFRNIDRVDIV